MKKESYFRKEGERNNRKVEREETQIEKQEQKEK